MYVKAFIVNVNKCLKPFFLEQHINIVNIVTLQSVWFICTPALHNGNQTKTCICLVHHVHCTSTRNNNLLLGTKLLLILE